ncbi:MAG: hypothetical protein KJN81_11975 [Acidimicrobiia bacterium]|nr:hypothetical protein [Acidimicrobiia bacterium]NNC42928.1 hypothetical protein [Acidimicrobiia bacterium]NNL29137.1 hypothetical protein [Acidimicrobiia bacterium]
MASRIEVNYETAGLDERRLATLRFADKLTRSPQSMDEDDVMSLRAAGLTDLDVLHVTEIVGYYAYVNRLADALGVPIESWIDD